MRTIGMLFLLFFSLFSLNAQDTSSVIIGKIHKIHSEILNENREIWIHVPATYHVNSENEKYPVVYLLDGDNLFNMVVGMIEQLSSINGNDICPQMIIVGIQNTDRTRDFTPTHIEDNLPMMDSSMCATSGGADKFVSFLEKELFPYIETNYPVAPYRMLIGHSLGGLLTMYTLFNKNYLFNSYVAIEPSMWWDNRKLLKESEGFLKQKDFDGKTLFLAIANSLEDEIDTASIKNDTTIYTDQIRSLLILEQNIKTNKQNELKQMCNYYEDESHASVPLIAMFDALHFIFDYYKLKVGSDFFTNENYKTDSIIENHYTIVSKNLNYEVKPQEVFINMVGYFVLSLKQYEKAINIFKLNVKYYPESADVYDSLAEGYMMAGNNKLAVENYKKSLKLNPSNKNAEEQLEKLKNN